MAMVVSPGASVVRGVDRADRAELGAARGTGSKRAAMVSSRSTVKVQLEAVPQLEASNPQPWNSDPESAEAWNRNSLPSIKEILHEPAPSPIVQSRDGEASID